MSPPTPSHIDVQREFSKRLTVHKSLDQEVVVTTVDKVRLCLLGNQDCLRAQRQWLTPLSLLITLLAALLATDFKDFGLTAAVWEALFILAALASFVWLVIAGFRAWKNRAAGGIEQIIAELKAHPPRHPETSHPKRDPETG